MKMDFVASTYFGNTKPCAVKSKLFQAHVFYNTLDHANDRIAVKEK